MLRSSGYSGRCNAFVLFIVLVALELCSSEVSAATTATGSKVEYLPGLQHEGPLPFELETGYIGVGEADEVQVFYYFIKSERDPSTDPLVLWISGGPGCSSLAAIVHEFGPMKMDVVAYNGSLPTMSLNPYSWTKVASFMLIDLPVRTGFSYATTRRANLSNSIQESEHAVQFMRKWFIDRPKYLANPFYVGGDSFSGLVIPIVAHMISDGNEAGTKPWINLKGYILGNPETNIEEQTNYVIPFAYGMGLIPGDLYKSLEKNCKGDYRNIDPSNEPCARDMLIYQALTIGINQGHVLEPSCFRFAGPSDESDGQRRSLSEKPTLPHGAPCWDLWYNITEHWANDDSVREALHVRKGSIGRWSQCSTELDFSLPVIDVVPYHANLSARGCRALVYSGDHDMAIPSISTEAWIRSLNYSVVDNWRPWIVDGIVAGYTRSYSNNMTFATIKGSGHIPPFYNPAECCAMFKRWISGEKL